jgi:hypothetical protein
VPAAQRSLQQSASVAHASPFARDTTHVPSTQRAGDSHGPEQLCPSVG